MGVILNPAAIEALFHSPPVEAFIAKEAELVTRETQQLVHAYFGSAPTLTVDQDVGFSLDGNRATVGIRDGGSKAERIAANPDLLPKWLNQAIDAARAESL